jgi:uncharacterized membrane protein
VKKKISFQVVLYSFFAFIAMLIVVRFIFTGKHAFLFLIWNLFLAWIPFVISNSFSKIAQAKKWKQGLVFIIWFLFFPNALYIVTDLIHLDMESRVPKWYDALLVFSCSVAGLLMAFVSLLKVEKYLALRFSERVLHVIVIGLLFFGSFGVYLGRFLRWNSWDVITNPFSLLLSIGQRFIFPFQYATTWGITILFTIFFYLFYLAIKKLPGYLNQAIQ